MQRTKWPSGLAMAAGVWLIVSPFILGYGLGSAVTNNVVSGVIIVALAAAVFFGRVHTWADWGLVLMGGWVMASPAMFGYGGQSVASYNELVTGFAVAALAVVSMLLTAPSARRDYGATFASAEPQRDEEFRQY